MLKKLRKGWIFKGASVPFFTADWPAFCWHHNCWDWWEQLRALRVEAGVLVGHQAPEFLSFSVLAFSTERATGNPSQFFWKFFPVRVVAVLVMLRLRIRYLSALILSVTSCCSAWHRHCRIYRCLIFLDYVDPPSYQLQVFRFKPSIDISCSIPLPVLSKRLPLQRQQSFDILCSMLPVLSAIFFSDGNLIFWHCLLDTPSPISDCC